MSAQTCSSSSVSLVSLPMGRKLSPAPAESAIGSAGRQIQRKTEAPSGNGFLAKLWSAYRKYRNVARLRSLAGELDEHMLQDVGAPNWLINEVSVNRELTRLRDANYLRW
ncbi:hypothetical protein [Achromobacter sp. RTa]|uniref:hypothetical protein n=1 Tax=Achromobacter sp. RTa TaxID=1532557 RepID=UPI001E29083B|nr:hypothetical protein [Achromobacter sp. RTa]